MTARTEWDDFISRSCNLASAVAMMVLSVALLAVSIGVLFCSVFTTVFRVFRDVVDRMTRKIVAPELLRPGLSYRAGSDSLTSIHSFPDGNVTAVREGVQRLPTVQRPSSTLPTAGRTG